MAKIVGYYNMPTAGFGSDIPVSYFNTPTLDPFYPGWKHEPVPGWGARPSMAGPKMVAVGEAPSSAEHPAIVALKAEAASLYPKDPAKQAAHVMVKGPGFGRTLEQWLASPDSAPYRGEVASAKIFGLPRWAVYLGAAYGVGVIGYLIWRRSK